MTKIIRARISGYCMGVRRAVDIACKAACKQAETCKQTDVYTFGPLIHNPRALEELGCLGIQIMDEHNPPRDLSDTAVIIRAHGISPQTETALRNAGAKIVDATCPRVKASQLKAAAFAEAGCKIFLAGEETHAEIAGIRGYAGAGFYAVAGSAAQAETLAAQLNEKTPHTETALIGQTTITEEEYRAIGDAIKKCFPGIETAETICPVTSERQEDLRELADKVEAVIIAGGKESANTRRLLAVAQKSGKPCILAETAADIPSEFFNFKTIGLAAGTSTPDSVIKEIERGVVSGGKEQ